MDIKRGQHETLIFPHNGSGRKNSSCGRVPSGHTSTSDSVSSEFTSKGATKMH